MVYRETEKAHFSFIFLIIAISASLSFSLIIRIFRSFILLDKERILQKSKARFREQMCVNEDTMAQNFL